ncbi:hypothetical protein [Paracraurococcus lichenis]|uniref:Uncharacterized protein n=1 Tax=Paracraurococcus lichenis TaxID=3064888 RepID=A0ABT9E721_9PROT|nr:hypothetical protein [Paracraurococcus sp. LOR1-02]MDO9711986.1 hypothetical protein [Paracraurococcus sp. LOR1-02]
MQVKDLRQGEGITFDCGCRTLMFSRRELINAFGADTPLEHIGLRYRCSRCDMPAQRAWASWVAVEGEHVREQTVFPW